MTEDEKLRKMMRDAMDASHTRYARTSGDDEFSHFEYFVAENTGWSGGSSWFQIGTKNFLTYREAKKVAKARKKEMPDSKHRVRKVVIHETYFEC